MIIVLPFLDIQMYIEIDCYEYGLQLIDRYITTDNTGFFFYEYINKYQNISTPLIYLAVDDTNLN